VKTIRLTLYNPGNDLPMTATEMLINSRYVKIAYPVRDTGKTLILIEGFQYGNAFDIEFDDFVKWMETA
jgi:translation initiation factor 1 (eIF-1/SUI1)